MTSNFDLANTFLENGYVIMDIADPVRVHNLQSLLLNDINATAGTNISSLEEAHTQLPYSEINSIRLHAYNALNSSPDLLEDYFSIFGSAIIELLGTELASQNKVNLNIQLPNDETSRLGLHTDTVSGQSEFEIVAWLPLTAAFGSNSMFLFNIKDSQEMLSNLPAYQTRGMDALYQDWASKSIVLDVQPGRGVIFSSILMHGNLVNRTDKSRVSLNGRFKALFSPYNQLAHSEKKIGSFYRPLRISPVTRLALRYEEPDGKF